jgi:hypothetical protein
MFNISVAAIRNLKYPLRLQLADYVCGYKMLSSNCSWFSELTPDNYLKCSGFIIKTTVSKTTTFSYFEKLKKFVRPRKIK